MSTRPQRGLKPRKRPTQERSAALVSAVVAAATRILADEGAARLTTNRIAEVAGVSIGSVYQYFPNKDAIVVAVIAEKMADDRRLNNALLARNYDSVVHLAQEFAQTICLHVADSARLMVALMPLLSPLQQEEFVRNGLRDLGKGFQELLQRYPEEIRPELHEPQRLEMAVEVFSNAIRGALHAAMHTPARLRDPDFHRELAALAGSFRRNPA
jgi:AcrR family transcriptional regulator